MFFERHHGSTSQNIILLLRSRWLETDIQHHHLAEYTPGLMVSDNIALAMVAYSLGAVMMVFLLGHLWDVTEPIFFPPNSPVLNIRSAIPRAEE